jgi:putative nucleotidyltransferase with HDIG domain
MRQAAAGPPTRWRASGAGAGSTRAWSRRCRRCSPTARSGGRWTPRPRSWSAGWPRTSRPISCGWPPPPRSTGSSRPFAGIIDAKSPYTFQHSERVAALSVRLGSALDLPGGELQRLRRAALLHDIGKLGLPNRILDHPGALSAKDRAHVREHPRHTARILGRVPVLSAVAATAAAHHERLDGSGYPDGLRGEALDRPTRILAVADVFEALSADRPYRPALSRPEALAVVQQEAGSRLCADTAAALVGVLAQTA